MMSPEDRAAAAFDRRVRQLARPRAGLRAAALVAVLFVALAAGVLPTSAQVIDPQGCADSKDMRKYLVDNPAIQDAGLKEGVDLMAEYDMLIKLTCGEALAPAQPSAPADLPAPIPPPAPAPPAADPPAAAADSPDSADRLDACNLLSATETALVIGGSGNADTPANFPGASGCEYRSDGSGNVPYLDVMYEQAAGNDVYASLLATADQNTDSPPSRISGIGEHAFAYAGGNGPGMVVLKGNKVVILEFGYTNPGEAAFQTLARQAAARMP